MYVDMFMQALCQDGYVLCLYVMHIYGEKHSHQEWEFEGTEVEDRDSVQGSAEPRSFA